MIYTEHKTRCLGTALLKFLRASAVTTPWRRVYIRPDYWNATWVHAHEFAHVLQIYRDGEFAFWTRIVKEYIVYGRSRSPYEIEAMRFTGIVLYLRGYEWDRPVCH